MYDDQEMIAKMMEMGANAYLTKTTDPEEIYNAILTCMNDDFYFNDLLNKAVMLKLQQKKTARQYYPTPTKFTEKEVNILKLIAQDKTTEEISKEVYLSPRTIETIRQNMKTKVGVKTNDAGFIEVDKVSRTSVRGVYAAGDCTGVMMLASVAAMQGRIAMWHALGDAVHPLNLETVSSNVFTDPEIATVGVSQADIDSRTESANAFNLPLATNARAKMQGISEGFVKIFCRPDTGVIVGGVVVAPKASELIFSIALAVEHRLTVDQMSQTITVYPSLSGSIAEAARQLHQTQSLN
jgi:pyruvate/2-oxoglutarate dehydrogenase complex dihydrolipoamide dehydrogenase (E3) component